MVHKQKFHHALTGGSFVFVFAFFLNFVWESIQAVFLYAGHAEFSAMFFVRMVVYASTIDGLLITSVFVAGCLLFKSDCWLESYKKKEVLFTVVLGVVIAAIIEIKALFLGQWQYAELMPTIFGIGLSPLVQLAITGALSMFLTSKLFYSRK